MATSRLFILSRIASRLSTSHTIYYSFSFFNPVVRPPTVAPLPSAPEPVNLCAGHGVHRIGPARANSDTSYSHGTTSPAFRHPRRIKPPTASSRQTLARRHLVAQHEPQPTATSHVSPIPGLGCATTEVCESWASRLLRPSPRARARRRPSRGTRRSTSSSSRSSPSSGNPVASSNRN